MRILTIAAAIVACLYAGTAAQAREVLTGTEVFERFGVDFETAEVTIETIAPGLHVLYGVGGNIAVSVGEQGVLVVDDQFPAMVPRIETAIRKLNGGAIDFVINTHWHFDHTDGNPLLAEGGSWIVSHANSRRMMTDDRLVDLVTHLVEQPASPAGGLPVITYDDRMQFHFNGERIDLLYFGPAHTTGDAAVFFRGHNAVHMGDVFNGHMYPFIDVDNGGDLDGVIRFCEAVLEEMDDQAVVIPGHGPVGNYADLVGYLSMLKTVRERVATLIERGATLEEVTAARPTAEWDADRGDPTRFLDRAYKSLSR